MRSVLVPLLVAAAACQPPPPRAEPPADRPRYVVSVRVSRPFRIVTGDLRVTFTPNRPTDRLVFRLWPNGPPQLQAGSRLEVGAVKEGATELDVARPNPTTLDVALGRELVPGTSVTVQLPWRLHMPRSHLDRIARFPDGLRLGTFMPLLAWDPRRGWVTERAARILAESATTPTADFDLRVRSPKGLRVLASGDPLGAGRFRALAVRDLAVTVGRYRIRTTALAGVTIRVAAITHLNELGADLAVARRAIRKLSRRYGSYPWHSYTLVVPADLPPSGIEYPTLSFVGRSRYRRLIIDHETAHQWFYSLVGNDQFRDPWLDETLATWSQTRLGAPELPSNRRIPAGARRHVGEPVPYWERRPDWYFYGVYAEGVRALHSLGNDAAVDCALRHYVARHAYSIAEPGDLLDELDHVIPGAERRLRAWGIRR
jgi:hypothetical protein